MSDHATRVQEDLGPEIKGALIARIIEWSALGGWELLKKVLPEIAGKYGQHQAEKVKRYVEKYQETMASIDKGYFFGKYREESAIVVAWLKRVENRQDRKGGGGKYVRGDFFRFTNVLIDLRESYGDKDEKSMYIDVLLQLGRAQNDAERDQIIRINDHNAYGRFLAGLAADLDDGADAAADVLHPVRVALESLPGAKPSSYWTIPFLGRLKRRKKNGRGKRTAVFPGGRIVATDTKRFLVGMLIVLIISIVIVYA